MVPRTTWWEDAAKKGVDPKAILFARAYEFILANAGKGTPMPHLSEQKSVKQKAA